MEDFPVLGAGEHGKKGCTLTLANMQADKSLYIGAGEHAKKKEKLATTQQNVFILGKYSTNNLSIILPSI